MESEDDWKDEAPVKAEDVAELEESVKAEDEAALEEPVKAEDVAALEEILACRVELVEKPVKVKRSVKRKVKEEQTAAADDVKSAAEPTDEELQRQLASVEAASLRRWRNVRLRAVKVVDWKMHG